MVPVLLLVVVVVLVMAWLLRRVLKLFLWFAVAVLVGVGIPGVVLGVLFLVARLGGVH